MKFLVDLSLGLGLLAIAVVLLRLRADVRRQTLVLTRFLEAASIEHILDSAASSSPYPWPDDAPLQPGAMAPPSLASSGDWVVGFLDNQPNRVADVLTHVMSADLLNGYLLTAVMPNSSAVDLPPSDIRSVVLEDAWFEEVPLPSALLIGPDGTIQGVGNVATATALLGFVAEGDANGFGPRHRDHQDAARGSHHSAALQNPRTRHGRGTH